jgi:hypothetical protein
MALAACTHTATAREFGALQRGGHEFLMRHSIVGSSFSVSIACFTIESIVSTFTYGVHIPDLISPSIQLHDSHGRLLAIAVYSLSLTDFALSFT